MNHSCFVHHLLVSLFHYLFKKNWVHRYSFRFFVFFKSGLGLLVAAQTAKPKFTTRTIKQFLDCVSQEFHPFFYFCLIGPGATESYAVDEPLVQVKKRSGEKRYSSFNSYQEEGDA